MTGSNFATRNFDPWAVLFSTMKKYVFLCHKRYTNSRLSDSSNLDAESCGLSSCSESDAESSLDCTDWFRPVWSSSDSSDELILLSEPLFLDFSIVSKFNFSKKTNLTFFGQFEPKPTLVEPRDAQNRDFERRRNSKWATENEIVKRETKNRTEWIERLLDRWPIRFRHFTHAFEEDAFSSNLQHFSIQLILLHWFINESKIAK